ncbi:hypothetical protein R3W88_014916 [Solanum pinnatisectum]|uniref:PB1-like domain-containing protein n=1 Tax=Solanum pinnatisectum TaxID=50273 RepID=A0AAV9KUD4_9SOLN|nr:hypothetical protein R3W88_014916 [Solanum pinnatisectum]
MSFVLNFEMVSWGEIVFGPSSDYVGGFVTEFLEVDTDRMSYFELKGYIKDLGYTTDCSFFISSPIDGFLVEVKSDKVICRMDVYVCWVGRESFTSFNEVESPNPNFGSSNHPTEPSSPPSEHFNPSSTTRKKAYGNSSETIAIDKIIPFHPLGEPSNTSYQPSNPTVEPFNISYKPSNPTIEPSNLTSSEVDSSEESLDSDVQEEYRDFRASRRHFNRLKQIMKMVEEEERPKYSRKPGEHTSNASRKRQGKRQRRGMPQGRQENENTCNGREMPQQNQVNKGTNRGIGMAQENHENEGTSGG